MPELVDQVYNAVLMFYRLSRANKKIIQGGNQIEIPVVHTQFGTSQWYRGFDQYNTDPVDVIKNAAFDWKQAVTPVTIDGLSLIKNDSPESIANLVRSYHELARMDLEELIGTALFNDAVTDPKAIDGLQGAVDNGTVAATYGGLGARTTTNSFWQPAAGALDTTTAVLTLAALQTVFGATTDGARHPTIIITTQANYNRYQNLVQVTQRFPTEPMGRDEQLASAGFTNLLYNNVPFAVDPNCNANHIYFLNEDYIELFVSPRGDFRLDDFKEPVNQDAAVSSIKFAGNLCVKNIARQGLMNAVAA